MDIDAISAEKTFPEPQLVITGQGETAKGSSLRKNRLEVDGFNILEGLITLLSCYYVVYVRYSAAGTLLFLQEVVLHELAKVIRKPARYSSLINSVL